MKRTVLTALAIVLVSIASATSHPADIAKSIAETNDEVKIDRALEKVTQENCMEVLKEYAKIKNATRFFRHVMESGWIYRSDKGKPNNVRHHVIDIGYWMLDYAKAHGVYTDNYDTQIRAAIRRQDNIQLHKELDNFYKRISTSQNASQSIASQYWFDGMVDADFRQNKINDCWLLATLSALNNNPDGRRQLQSLILARLGMGQDSIYVKLQGQYYGISFREIRGSTELSSGDLDVRGIEVAMDRFLHRKYDQSINTCKYLPDGFHYLFGENNINVLEYNMKRWDVYLTRMQLRDDLVSIVGTRNNADEYDLYDQNNQVVHVLGGHACAAIGADSRFIYLIDPKHSKDTLRCPLEIAPKVIITAAIANFVSE